MSIAKYLSIAVVVVALAVAIEDHPTHAQSNRDGGSGGAVVQPAIDGILAAFETYPLVGLSDKHGLAQEMEFYEALIRDPRFARNVGNVVVEFGGAARQDVIDLYTNGEFVAYPELRRVWTDTVGWLPTVQWLGYAHFFSQVRETNSTLLPEERIRIWLGEPPIVWETIESREDYMEFADRDGHAANLIVDKILAQDKKALVIYGGDHFRRLSAEEEALRAQWAEVDPENATSAAHRIPGLVEARYPAAFFIVQVYAGFEDSDCTSEFEQRMENWPTPALATAVRGTTLEEAMLRCSPARETESFPPTMPQALQDLLQTQPSDVLYHGDAILFLGEAASFTNSPMFPDLYLDEEYRREISRHMEILGFPFRSDYGKRFPVTPIPYE